MLEHHIQKSIVKQLAFSESGLRFSDLQPQGVENKLFDYHLKIAVRDGLVEKNQDGVYQLTSEGRRLGLRAFRVNDYTLAAYSVLFLLVKNVDGHWLLYRRKAHPLIGKIGFMHAVPVVEETLSQTASRELNEKTGLSGKFQHRGSGYFKMYDQTSLESFTHFDLMVCDEASGELKQLHENAEYFWEESPDFASEEMIPNMKTLAEAYDKGDQFFIEERIDL